MAMCFRKSLLLFNRKILFEDLAGPLRGAFFISLPQECSFGSFSRMIPLHVEVEIDKAEAAFKKES